MLALWAAVLVCYLGDLLGGETGRSGLGYVVLATSPLSYLYQSPVTDTSILSLLFSKLSDARTSSGENWELRSSRPDTQPPGTAPQIDHNSRP